MPLFSIIIPTFNSASTLAPAIDSVLAQEYTDFEIWVIDGKSTDTTVDILRDYQQRDQRLHFISESDHGIYDAMNKGIDRAEGQWLYFLGSDDKLYNNGVLKTVAGKVKEGSADVVYGNVLIKGSTPWAKDAKLYDGEFDLKKLFNKNICHQSIFYKTDFIKGQVGLYNAEYKVCADWDYNFRCWAKSPFTYLNMVVAEFSGGGESSKGVVDTRFNEDIINNLLTYFNLSAFDPLIDQDSLWFHQELVQYQKKNHLIRYAINRIRTKLV